jgi:para-nitrobenzyl esterase
MSASVVSTASGRVRGTTNARGVHVFRGIRYGAPVTGSLRFKPPTPVTSWTGEFDATEHALPCPQPLLIGRIPGRAVVPRPHGEDCLSLEVWSANLSDTAKQPVVVWLHGGAWTVGCSWMQASDGTHLALEHGIVTVGLNFRIGALGFLHLEPLLGEEFHGSSNAGLLDLIAALRWIRENISAFGGDPDNVTIIGESGTGNKTLALMATPAARGLFHRAWCISGALLRVVDAERATNFAQRLVHELNVKPAELQSVPVRRIADAQEAVLGGPTAGVRLGIGPVLDGDVIPAHPFDPETAAGIADIPLVIGSNKDEGTQLLRQIPDHSDESLEDWLDLKMRPITGAQTERLLAAYRDMHPEYSAVDAVVAARSDLMRVPILRNAERYAASGKGPAYFYLYTYESSPEFRAGHASGVSYLFGNVETASEREDRFAFAETMSGTLAALAHTGSPNNPRIPEWPAYSPDKRETMVLDIMSRIENDPMRSEAALWDDLDPDGW